MIIDLGLAQALGGDMPGLAGLSKTIALGLVVAGVLLVADGTRPSEATSIVNVTKVYISDRCDDKPGYINQFFSGIPTDPRPDQNSLGTCNGIPSHNWYVTADYTVSTYTWVYLGVWDPGRGIWVAHETIDRGPGSYQFLSTIDPGWIEFKNLAECTPGGLDFTRCADAYEFYAYYWTGSQWWTEDVARGLVAADWDWTPIGDTHFHWSPNSYARPTKGSPYSQNGKSWVQAEWRMAYYNGMEVGGATPQGTARLNRLKGWTGSLQLEFRRDTEGWDAVDVTWANGWCLFGEVFYWQSSIPGFQVTNEQTEETHAITGGECGYLEQEEAQGKSTSESSWTASTLTDASNALVATGYWYYRQTFLRRTANQGQQFRLQTEFELNGDTAYPTNDLFDVVIATQRAETY